MMSLRQWVLYLRVLWVINRARGLYKRDQGLTFSHTDQAGKLRLPDYFSPWEKVCDKIPQLVKDGTARSIIEKLPLLDVNFLSSQKEWFRAHLLLTCITHAYVWCEGEKGAKKKLPKCVAVPLVAVSRHLDLPPAITYYTMAFCNWRRNGPSNSDLKLINTFTGTESEESFILTAVILEFEFGKGGALALINGQQAVLDDNINQLMVELTILQQLIKNMTSVFLKIHETCDPREFYFLLRPFYNGWGEGTPLADGLIYEGVSPEPMKFSGGSAAQSSVFQAIDGFLGIKHKTENEKTHFLHKMRLHMPPKHRAFISAIENGPSVKSYVLQKADKHLTEKYNGCANAQQEFRNAHLRVVVRYIVCQANKDKESMLSDHGTGGTDLMPFLKKIRNETADIKV